MVENLYERRITTPEFMDMSLLLAKINNAVKRLSVGRGWVGSVEYLSVWESIARVVASSEARYQSAKIGGIEVNAGVLAGRIMVTFQRGNAQVTVIGEEGCPEKGCSLQSIEASADEVVAILDTVIEKWDPWAFKPNAKAIIA